MPILARLLEESSRWGATAGAAPSSWWRGGNSYAPQRGPAEGRPAAVPSELALVPNERARRGSVDASAPPLRRACRARPG